MRLIVRADAEADIAAAYDWYEEQREGLGTEFLAEVSIAIDAVQSEPLRSPAIFRTLRRALTQSSLSPQCISRAARGAFIVAPSQTSNKCFEPTRARPRRYQFA